MNVKPNQLWQMLASSNALMVVNEVRPDEIVCYTEAPFSPGITATVKLTYSLKNFRKWHRYIGEWL